MFSKTTYKSWLIFFILVYYGEKINLDLNYWFIRTGPLSINKN